MVHCLKKTGRDAMSDTQTEAKTLFSVDEASIATLTLNNPKTLNALSPQMLEELNAHLNDAALNPDIRVLVLTGAGRGFCSGADLSPQPGARKPETPEERGEQTRQRMHNGFNLVAKRLINLPFPTIARVNGVAAGAGYGLALAADLTIAAESAKFFLVFTNQLGLVPDVGASWHAPRALGRSRAMAAAFFGEKMSAEDAEKYGLIWQCVADDALDDTVNEVATRLANGPTKAYPQVRKLFDMASTQDIHAQLDLEAEIQPRLAATEDYVEGVRAFLQKRKPEFKGR
tara:strand:- start:169844 stop:170704 length:861 start_codon:yes stop_codon:yes gene_type:complete